MAQEERPDVPLDTLRAAAGDQPAAHEAIAAFHSAYSADNPDPKDLSAQAERVRGFSSLTATFERWWLDPRVQTFLADLNATGL